MNANTQSIYQIFDSGVSIEVPFFQRSYVWTTEEWKKFLSDMEDLCKQEKPYFLGADHPRCIFFFHHSLASSRL